MAASAFLGSKPATSDDYWIARYLLLQSHPAADVDPNNGFSIQPPRPPPSEYRPESKGASIIAGLSASIVVMVVITALRIWLRFRKTTLAPGSDDILIVFGVVSCLSHLGREFLTRIE
jgi:hypothetical protein